MSTKLKLLQLFVTFYLFVDGAAIELIDSMLVPVIQLLGSNKLSACGRDNILELLIKFVTRKDGIGWSKKFIEAEGKDSNS